MVFNVTEITVSYRWKILEKKRYPALEGKEELRRWAPAQDGLEPLKIPEIRLQELTWFIVGGQRNHNLLQWRNSSSEPGGPDAAGRQRLLYSHHRVAGFMGTGQPHARPVVRFVHCGSQATDQEVSLPHLHDLPDSIPSPSLGSIYILAKH